MNETKNNKLIHVASINLKGLGPIFLFLRQTKPNEYRWFKFENSNETETLIYADNIQEALRLGAQEWKNDLYQTLNCGFRYTLPERDEHGNNALFYQMATSYSSMNGVYFDDELGSNCIVHNASLKARNLQKQLQQEGRL